MKLHFTRILAFALCVLAFAGCKSGNKKALLPNVSGKAGEVLVVIEREQWEGNLGVAIREALAMDTPYLAQREPLFAVSNVPPGSFTNMFKVQKDWGKHSFDALVGYEAQRSRYQYVQGEGKGLPYGLYVLSVASDSKDVAGTMSVTGMQSFISQAAYNYASKYFLNASFRIDQSRFVPYRPVLDLQQAEPHGHVPERFGGVGGQQRGFLQLFGHHQPQVQDQLG